MPFLSPAKLLVIVVIALVVLGPDKLPTVAKQIGGLWRDFRRFREKLESEVRGSFPDLPSTDTITRAVRSPLAFLDNLAETDGSGNEPASDVAAGAGSPDGPGSEVGAAGSSTDRRARCRATRCRRPYRSCRPPLRAASPTGSAPTAEPALTTPG